MKIFSFSNFIISVWLLLLITTASADLLPELSSKVLTKFPKTDRNGDGKLTGSEVVMVKKQLLKKHPQIDLDSDGTLSLSEQTELLKKLGSNMGLTQTPTPERLAKFLQRFPESDANGDGQLSQEEASAYREALQKSQGKIAGKAKKSFQPDPGWQADKFPDHAVCYKSPEEIKALYKGTFPDIPKPNDGGLRIVGTGHSFMAPGYRTLPAIAEAAGVTQALHTHTSGGMTGSTRYKWEQENGIFGFEKPKPKLLSAISNAGWDVMLWGPYERDRPEYYTCWIDFCLKYNPEMKFYLSDAWIRLWEFDGGVPPKDESEYTPELLTKLEAEKHAKFTEAFRSLREKYPNKVYIIPTSLAFTKAAVLQVEGKLPGVESLHKLVTGKERSLWRDHRGHMGPGFDRLEGYVFYATLYKKSPELIEGKINFHSISTEKNYPSVELDNVFRKIAWQAVTENPLSGVIDEDGDWIGDR